MYRIPIWIAKNNNKRSFVYSLYLELCLTWNVFFNRLSDLAHAARNGSIETQRMVASIFLELVFNSEIRAQLTTRNIPGMLVNRGLIKEKYLMIMLR